MSGTVQGFRRTKPEDTNPPTDGFSNAEQILHIRGDALEEPNNWAGNSNRPTGQNNEREKRPGDLFGGKGNETQASLIRALEKTKKIQTW